MSLIQRVRAAMAGAGIGWEMSAPVVKSGASSLADTLFRLGFDAYPPTGALDNPMKHPTGYRAIMAFARNVAAMPFELFRAGTDDLVEDSPVGKLFERPNALMRGTQLFEALSIDLEARGNGLWWLGKPARASAAGLMLPASIRRLDPKRTKVKLNDNDEPLAYVFNGGGQMLTIPADQVMHFKFWDPEDEAWGTSWTVAADGEMEADYQASRWNRLFFRRGGEPGVMLIPEADRNISEPNAERIRAAFANKHRGRPHEIDILPVGLKVEKTGIGQKDMDFVNGRRFSRENTLSTAGVPPAIAGILEYANYANMMPQLRIFFHLELLPRLAYIEDVIQTDLLDRFKTGLEGYFKTEAIMALADEIGTKSEVAVRLSQIGVPLTIINDRLELGMDLEGVEGADQPRNQAPTVAPADPGAKPDQPPPPKPKPADEENDAERSIVLPRSWRSTQLDAVWRSMVQRVHDLELKAESRWRTHLRNLRDEAVRNLPLFVKGMRGRIVKVTDDSGSPGAAPAFDINDANDEAIVSLEPIWRASMGRGADTVAEQAGVRIDFHFTDPRVVKLLANRRQEIREVNERMLTELHELLSEGLAEQETEEDLRRRVLDYFGGERANARTVARTETFSAYSGGRFEAMREADIARHVWVTARDTKVRDSHAALEGERVLVGAPFSNGLTYPLDPSGGASEVINCRCVTIPEVA